jgi:cell wall-associated NlpC family hydrolase
MIAPQTMALGPTDNSSDLADLLLPQVGHQDFTEIMNQSDSPLTFTNAQGPAGDTRAKALKFAKQFVNKTDYVWGGTSPQGFDCSGLVQYVWKKFGVSLPRVSSQQAFAGKHVRHQPASADGPRGVQLHDIGHIAFYLGNGMILEAPHTGAKVRIRKLGNSAFDRNTFGVHLDIPG